MNPNVLGLMQRLARNPSEADLFFGDPENYLRDEPIPQVDREALVGLDRDALMYFDVAQDIEPGLAKEHPSNRKEGRHIATFAIGVWGCVAYVLFWLLAGGQF